MYLEWIKIRDHQEHESIREARRLKRKKKHVAKRKGRIVATLFFARMEWKCQRGL